MTDNVVSRKRARDDGDDDHVASPRARQATRGVPPLSPHAPAPVSSPRPPRRRDTTDAAEIDALARLVRYAVDEDDVDGAPWTDASPAAALPPSATLAAEVRPAPSFPSKVPLGTLNANHKGLWPDEGAGPAPASSRRSGPSPTTIAARGRRRRSSLSGMARVVPPTTFSPLRVGGGGVARAEANDVVDLTAPEPEPKPEPEHEPTPETKVKVEVELIDLTGSDVEDVTAAEAPAESAAAAAAAAAATPRHGPGMVKGERAAMTSPPAARAVRSAGRQSAGGNPARRAPHLGSCPKNLAGLFGATQTRNAGSGATPRSGAKRETSTPRSATRVPGVEWISVGDALKTLARRSSVDASKMPPARWGILWTVLARFFEDLVKQHNAGIFTFVPDGVRIEPFKFAQRMGAAAEGSARFLRFASPADENVTALRWVSEWRDIALAYIPTERGLLDEVEGAREFFAQSILRQIHFVLENNPNNDGFP